MDPGHPGRLLTDIAAEDDAWLPAWEAEGPAGPDDPTPYITEIWTALGLGYPHSEMDELRSRLTARDPHRYEAHFSALPYWCAWWRGSRQLATELAERAATSAPLGSLVTALPLIAHVNAALAADAAGAGADPTHPRLPELRHLLAVLLPHPEFVGAGGRVGRRRGGSRGGL